MYHSEVAQNIYDNPEFFAGYQKLRENPDNANVMEEKPALFSLAPDLAGKQVLDLGCGYGENCAAFRQLGAASVTGIDISRRMLEVAREKHPGAEYLRMDMSDIAALPGKYDVVFSSLAVHYIANFDGLCAQVAALLNEGGHFVFSQEHPITTAPLSGPCYTNNEQGERLHYNLSDYARSGKRENAWIVDNVVKYHRTMAEVVNTLLDNGFVIRRMLEPIRDETRKPNFLLVKAQKAGGANESLDC